METNTTRKLVTAAIGIRHTASLRVALVWIASLRVALDWAASLRVALCVIGIRWCIGSRWTDHPRRKSFLCSLLRPTSFSFSC